MSKNDYTLTVKASDVTWDWCFTNDGVAINTLIRSGGYVTLRYNSRSNNIWYENNKVDQKLHSEFWTNRQQLFSTHEWLSLTASIKREKKLKKYLKKT